MTSFVNNMSYITFVNNLSNIIMSFVNIDIYSFQFFLYLIYFFLNVNNYNPNIEILFVGSEFLHRSDITFDTKVIVLYIYIIML